MNATRSWLRRGFYVLVAVALCQAVRPAVAAAEEVLLDYWQIVHVAGARAGYEHVVVKRLSDPARIETSKESSIRIVRMSQAIEMTSLETTVEGEDGTLRSIAVVEKQSSVESKTTYAFEGSKAKVTTEAMGQTREAAVDVPAGLVGPWKAERMPVDAGFPAGKTFDVKVFLRELGGPKVVHTKVVGPEETELRGGKKATLVRLEQTIDGFPFVASSWLTKEGVIEKSTVTIAGMLVESWRATKEEALAKDDGSTKTPDLFVKTMILSKVLLPHARTMESALVRIAPKGSEARIPDLSSDRQTVERTEAGGAAIVRIRRTTPPPAAGTRPLANPAKDLAVFLAPSSALQSDDPAILKVAEEAVGGEKDAWTAAQKIERWVYVNLTKKGMGVGFASASEVCKNLEGDCTEHAVLVAAMCRAAGIPSRVVMGLEYIVGIWGGHAWTEVNVAGRWYALDATNAYGFVDALHLSVAATALAEGSFGQELTSLASFVGAVGIDVLEATWNGRALPVADPKAIGVDGRRYQNRLFDLTFEAPEGFTVEAPVPDAPGSRLAKVEGKTASGDAVEIAVHGDDEPAGGLERPQGATDAKIDGRAGFVVAGKQGGAEAVVLVGDTLFRFRLSSASADARAVLDALLATVDLDPTK